MDRKLDYFLDNTNYHKTTPVKKEIITSRTYTSGDAYGRWTKAENDLFYDALEVCGLDFTLIEQLFEKRSRKQIKNKFRKEMKNNTIRLQKILDKKTSFNKEAYEKLKNMKR